MSTDHQKLEITTRKDGDIIVVEPRGRATLGENSELLDRELQRLAAEGWKKMLVDLSGLIQIDSSGISALVRQCTGLARKGGSLRLVCPAGRVRDALSVTRLLEAIPTFNTLAAALGSFQAKAAN
ncbi:MAG: STAS domain-containing protein [Candidatus Acidiferrales bacterium]